MFHRTWSYIYSKNVLPPRYCAFGLCLSVWADCVVYDCWFIDKCQSWALNIISRTRWYFDYCHSSMSTFLVTTSSMFPYGYLQSPRWEVILCFCSCCGQSLYIRVMSISHHQLHIISHLWPWWSRFVREDSFRDSNWSIGFRYYQTASVSDL